LRATFAKPQQVIDHLNSKLPGCMAFLGWMFLPVSAVVFSLVYDRQSIPRLCEDLAWLVTGVAALTAVAWQVIYAHRKDNCNRNDSQCLTSQLKRWLRQEVTLGVFWAVAWRLGLVALVWLFLRFQPTFVTWSAAALDMEASMFGLDVESDVWFRMAALAAVVYLPLAALSAAEAAYRDDPFKQIRQAAARLSSWFGKTAFRTDVAAMVISSVVFAIVHLQFHPVILVEIFVLGCLMTQLFRRTGTLWTGILFHIVNNAFYFGMIGLGWI
jgi:membrane protease YdiL (CAAX protease family)